jgi:hypothetical protein
MAAAAVAVGEAVLAGAVDSVENACINLGSALLSVLLPKGPSGSTSSIQVAASRPSLRAALLSAWLRVRQCEGERAS